MTGGNLGAPLASAQTEYPRLAFLSEPLMGAEAERLITTVPGFRRW